MKGEISPEKLLNFWSRGQLSNDETMRGMLQWLIRQQTAIATLNVTVYQLRGQIDPHQAILDELQTSVEYLKTVANRLTTLSDDQATT
ncbi:hypothetical protein QUF58_06445 [Anaerolineales bacterium HSG24]|nr:hypothetical protein [Anaerolineales bacterium HSG24]